MQRVPDLRFTVEDAYEGIDMIVINYRNQNGGLVNEVLKFGGEPRRRRPRDVSSLPVGPVGKATSFCDPH